MAAQSENEQTESAGASNTVWPPPPTGPAPPLPTPRSPIWLIHLPLSPFLAPFALPKWATSAFTNAVLMFIASDLRHKAPLIGQIVVGLSIAYYSVLLFTMLFWAVRAAGRFAVHKISKAPLELPSAALPDYLMSVGGGGMSFVPSSAFWIWGQFYLFWGMDGFVSRTFLAIQAVWFIMGCLVAVVNGVRHWLREWRTSREGL